VDALKKGEELCWVIQRLELALDDRRRVVRRISRHDHLTDGRIRLTVYYAGPSAMISSIIMIGPVRIFMSWFLPLEKPLGLFSFLETFIVDELQLLLA
jgi:hypothetical protein